MAFLMGSALWWGIGALVVSIPIIIHLLHRQRTQPVLWGAMIFLRMSILQQKRRKRVEHWLLMALRLLLLAVLVGLLAIPQFKQGVMGAVGGRPATDIAIIVDHSLSTQWQSGDKPVYQQEIAAVQQLAAQDVFKQGDTVTLVLAEKTPRVICEAQEYDKLGQWIEKLKSQKPGSTRASIPAAVQTAREVMNARGKNYAKRIVIISDQQRNNWEAGGSPDQWAAAVGTHAAGLEPPVKVYAVPVKAGDQRSNLAVENLEINPDPNGIIRPIGANRPVEVRATVRNTGSTPMPGATAALWVDGEPAKLNGSPLQAAVRALPPRDTKSNSSDYVQTVSFSYAFPKAKSCWVEVRVDAAGDGFPVDNVATGSVQVMDMLPVLIVDRQTGEPMDGLAVDNAEGKKYEQSADLVHAILSDAPNRTAAPLMMPTVVSALDIEHLRGLVKTGAQLPVRDWEGKLRTERRVLDDFAAVILNDVSDLDPTFISKLRDYVDSGHGVWCILGESTKPSYLRDQISGTGLFPLVVPNEPTSFPMPKPVEVADPQYDVLKNFQTSEQGYLSRFTVERFWSVTPAEDGSVKLAAPGAGPLILDRKPPTANDGRVILLTTPLSGKGAWNNWLTYPISAPLINRTMYQLTAGVTRTPRSAQLKAGDRIVWFSPPLRDPPDAATGGQRYMLFPGGIRATPVRSAELTTPGGEKKSVRVEMSNARQTAYFAEMTPEAGRYEVGFPEQKTIPVTYYGVGIDQREMDPETLTDSDVKWLSAQDHQFLEKIIEPSELATALSGTSSAGPKIWPWIAGVLLLFLLLETFLTYRMVRRQSGPSDVPGVMPTAPVAQAA